MNAYAGDVEQVKEIVVLPIVEVAEQTEPVINNAWQFLAQCSLPALIVIGAVVCAVACVYVCRKYGKKKK